MPPRKRSSATPATAPRKASTNLPNGPVADDKAASMCNKIAGMRADSHELASLLAKFPLVLFINLVISGVLYSIAAEFLAGDLGQVSRQGADLTEAAGWIACKAAELLFSWLWGLDGTY